MNRRCALLPLVVALLLAAPLVASAEEWGEFTREELFASHFPEAPGADAVILCDEAVLRVDEALRLKVRHHRRVKIFTSAGAESHAEMRIPLGSDDRIEDLRAHTVVPPNRAVEAKGDRIREVRDEHGRAIVVSFPDVTPGVILEARWEHRKNDPSVVSPWTFRNDDFTRVSRFVMLVPDGLSYRTAFTGTTEEEPAAERRRIPDPELPRREVERVRWEKTGVAGLGNVPYLAGAEDAGAALYVQFEAYRTNRDNVTFERTWEELAGQAAAEDAAALAAAGGAGAAAALAAGQSDPEAKARAIFAAVRDADGPAGDLRNVRLAAALREAGLDAAVVRIRSRRSGKFLEAWHALEGLDRSIVLVTLGGRPVALDAAVPGAPFGVLPPECRVERGLRVAESGGGVVDVTPSAPRSARQVKTTATIDSSGHLAATSVMQMTGDHALAVRRLVAADGERAWAESIVLPRFPGARVESVKLLEVGDPEKPLAARIAWAADGWATRRENAATSPCPFLFAETATPFVAESREHPVCFGWAGTTKEEVSVTWPEGSTVGRVPADASGSADGVAFLVSWKKADDGLHATRTFQIGTPTIPESSYESVRSLWKDLVDADATPVTAQVPSVRMAEGR